jgi:hypothetical protein
MFWWLNELIDSPLYSFSGVSVITDVLQGREWQVLIILKLKFLHKLFKETGHFPRITHCDVPRRMLANSPVSFRYYISYLIDLETNSELCPNT